MVLRMALGFQPLAQPEAKRHCTADKEVAHREKHGQARIVMAVIGILSQSLNIAADWRRFRRQTAFVKRVLNCI
jgi:hypothetical protein